MSTAAVRDDSGRPSSAAVAEELANELSWSVSRARTLAECARQYYWSYYGAWGGWDPEADEQTRLAYRLKRMVNLDMWAGDIVHRVIAEMLLAVREGRPFPSFDDVRERARFILNAEWLQSRDRAWEDDPKRFRNLMEHYYERGVTRDRRLAVRDRIFACLWHFGRSGVLREIMETEREQRDQESGESPWLMLEEMASFSLSLDNEPDARAFARPDLVLRRPGKAPGGTDEVVVYDWKTGRENEKDRLQVAAYALFAQQQWQVPQQSIRVVLFYLRNGVVRSHSPAQDELDAVRATVAEDVSRMRAKLRDVERNEAVKDDFPLTSRRRSCERCAFWELCAPELAG